MIKWKMRIGALIMALLFLLGGCTGQRTAPEPEDLESNREPEDFIGLTAEQRIEDLEFVRETLELYPIRDQLKRAQVADIDGTLAGYRKKVEHGGSDLEFLNDMRRMFWAFGSKGHLSLYDTKTYQEDRDLWEMLDNKVKMQILNDDKSRSTYGQLETSPDTGLFALRQTEEKSEAGASTGKRRQVVLEKLDESTAYIRIYSFNGLYMEEDGPKVAQFIEDCAGMDNLILDIRGNGGGNAGYWRKYIVGPNISERMVYHLRYLYDDKLLQSEAAHSQLMAEHPDIQAITRPIAELPPYENLSEAARRFTYFAEGEFGVDPEPSAHPFTGRVWLLVDGGVGSASEMLVNFCQQTGFATTVGEMTAGANCFGNPYLFTMPNSGQVFRFDPFYGLNPDGTCNNIHGVTPQIPCASKDALDVCLQEIRK